MKLELLTNATFVDDAIRFVESRNKDTDNANIENDKKEYYSKNIGNELCSNAVQYTNHVF